MVVTATYDPYLVVLSILVAGFASYTALDLGGRVALAQGPTHRIWLAGAALTMGGGIWSMHFVAMLAFMLPMPVSYDVGLTVLSLMLAILATGGSFYVISRPGVSRPRLVLSGVFMGFGILAMHYTGMAAMRGPVELSYDPLWVALSVIIAIGAATAALWLAFRTTNPGQKLAAAIVLGFAISGMHYTGMRAAICTAHATRRTLTRSRPSIGPPWRWRSPVSCSPIWPPCSPPCPSASAPTRPCVRRRRILPTSNGSPPWESWRPRLHMKSCSRSGRE